MHIVPTPNPTFDSYYAALSNYAQLGVTHEQGIRSAFRGLLDAFARPAGWTLVEEHALLGSLKRPDGTLLDSFQIPRGYWEAKDTKDDLEAEIRRDRRTTRRPACRLRRRRRVSVNPDCQQRRDLHVARDQNTAEQRKYG